MSTENVSIVVPSSPADIKKIFLVIKQISDSKTRAKSESDYQKEALETLSKEFGIEVKHLRQMANDYHKDQFDKKASEFDEYTHLYETVVNRGAKIASGNVTDVDLDEEE